jgi:Abnormal spindle-like microcephaly-assoc'd, ASPM-SPD-2-Hydin
VFTTPRSIAASGVTVTPHVLNFSNIVVGQSQINKIVLQNSGGSAVILSGGSISGAGFSLSGIVYPQTLGAGAQVSLEVKFAPAKSGYSAGTVEIFIKGGGYAELPLKGTGVASSSTAPSNSTGYLSATPLRAQFQNVPVGIHDTQIIQLTNTGSAGLTISSVAATGNGFSVTGAATPLSIAAGGTAQITVGFLPESVGSSSGSVALTSTASDGLMTIVLAGTSVGTSRLLSVSPASLAFGNVIVNGSATQQLTLKNGGNSSISISGGSISGVGLSATGVAAVTLAAGQTAVVTAEFAPKTAGSVAGGITIISNASNGGSITIPVTGTGVTAAQAVTLRWQASTSTGVIGYYIYRSTVSGGPYTKVAASLIAGTSYSDTNVISGTEYYYVVTSLGENGIESTYSAQVTASVP